MPLQCHHGQRFLEEDRQRSKKLDSLNKKIEKLSSDFKDILPEVKEKSQDNQPNDEEQQLCKIKNSPYHT